MALITIAQALDAIANRVSAAISSEGVAGLRRATPITGLLMQHASLPVRLETTLADGLADVDPATLNPDGPVASIMAAGGPVEIEADLDGPIADIFTAMFTGVEAIRADMPEAVMVASVETFNEIAGALKSAIERAQQFEG